MIRVEYEIPPLRAIYQEFFEDGGQDDTEITEDFKAQNSNRRIRKIERIADDSRPKVAMT